MTSYADLWTARLDSTLEPTGSAWWRVVADDLVAEVRAATAAVVAAEGLYVTDDVWLGPELGYGYSEPGVDDPSVDGHERYAQVAVALFDAALEADTLMQDGGDSIVLEVHLCDQRRSIRVSFATEAQAVAYYRQHSATRVMDDFNPDVPSVDPERHPVLWDLMHPVCDHGLSLANCFGPQHYAMEY